MKKVLVIISFAFIILLSLSIVSAKITGRATRGTLEDTEKIGTGDTTTFNDGSEVTITTIDSDTGQISGTLTTTDGSTQTFSLAEGQTSTSVGGIKITTGDIRTGLFGFGSPTVPITISSPTDISTIGGSGIDGSLPGLPTRGEIEGLTGEVGCDLLEEEEALIYLGEGTFLNGHTVDLDEEGGLIVDETYAYPPLEDGGYYLVPIPNPDCYWEASFEDGELYMYTICNVAEEFAGEEFVG